MNVYSFHWRRTLEQNHSGNRARRAARCVVAPGGIGGSARLRMRAEAEGALRSDPVDGHGTADGRPATRRGDGRAAWDRAKPAVAPPEGAARGGNGRGD